MKIVIYKGNEDDNLLNRFFRVNRIYDHSGRPAYDLVCMDDESLWGFVFIDPTKWLDYNKLKISDSPKW